MCRVLVIGAGGREHALVWRLSLELGKNNVFVSPGNDGMTNDANVIPLNIYDFQAIAQLIKESNINLVVVGPEEPIVKGWKESLEPYLSNHHVRIISPSTHASILEASKAWAKNFCQRHQIPTADFQVFTHEEMDKALNFLKSNEPPYVIKADGLAAGKGVAICSTLEEAQQNIKDIFVGRRYGDAGKSIVIEKFLKGIEVSVFIATDGTDYVLLPEAKDYKRVFERDIGPNTGGMGTVSPVPFVNDSIRKKIETQIIQPTLEGLKTENIHYSGFLFFGLMIVQDHPFLIEYNVRLGDPETQVILPQIKSSFVELLQKMAEGNLRSYEILLDDKVRTCVVLTAKGYPNDFKKNLPFTLPSNISSLIFCAGVKKVDHQLFSTGGRILGVVSEADTLPEAINKVYHDMQYFSSPDFHFRKDIGQDLLR
ncbi:MAG: phosphoribosylamine--glycine ligase [Bacteroidales bacterium]|nr:phosphoribosylamine--glycine ligase [Bacteroidales bacterium]